MTEHWKYNCHVNTTDRTLDIQPAQPSPLRRSLSTTTQPLNRTTSLSTERPARQQSDRRHHLRLLCRLRNRHTSRHRHSRPRLLRHRLTLHRRLRGRHIFNDYFILTVEVNSMDSGGVTEVYTFLMYESFLFPYQYTFGRVVKHHGRRK